MSKTHIKVWLAKNTKQIRVRITEQNRLNGLKNLLK